MSDYVLRLREMVGPDVLLQLPSVSTAVRDADERVLLARHVEGGNWLLPGGSIEPAELPADAALRETWEETGLVVRLTGLVGVFGGPEFVVEYRNSQRASYVMIVFEAVVESGEPGPRSSEIQELGFFSSEESERLPLADWVPQVLKAFFDPSAGRCVFGAPNWTPPA